MPLWELPRPQLKTPSGTVGKRPVLNQILAGSLLKPDFGHLAASRPANKTAFWDYWETARFGSNPGREPFGARFWQFGGFRATIERAFWDHWETARFGSNPGREPFGAKFWQFGGFWVAVKFAFWTIGKRPSKSWPGAFWSLILSLSFQAGKRLLGSLGHGRFGPNPAGPFWGWYACKVGSFWERLFHLGFVVWYTKKGFEHAAARENEEVYGFNG